MHGVCMVGAHTAGAGGARGARARGRAWRAHGQSGFARGCALPALCAYVRVCAGGLGSALSARVRTRVNCARAGHAHGRGASAGPGAVRARAR